MDETRAAVQRVLVGACETCGDPASWSVQDCREVDPVDGFTRWERDGPAHLFCDAHVRGPMETYRKPFPAEGVPS